MLLKENGCLTGPNNIYVNLDRLRQLLVGDELIKESDQQSENDEDQVNNQEDEEVTLVMQKNEDGIRTKSAQLTQ